MTNPPQKPPQLNPKPSRTPATQRVPTPSTQPLANPSEQPDKETQDCDRWQPYELDYYAERLVIKHRDKEDVLNESHKMRMTVAYGLERFWGEQFRLRRERRNQDKAQYWQEAWETLANKILKPAGINLLPEGVSPQSGNQQPTTPEIDKIAEHLWNNLDSGDRQIALMVLTQFCDCLVWWTQRYKKDKKKEEPHG